MIIRQVSIELNEKQYEKLCQVAASAGKTVRKVLQTFAEELPENESLQDWLGQKQERNFLAYLSEKGKLELMTSLIERTVSYQTDLSEAYAKGKSRAVSIAEEKLKTSWQLIQGEYIQYKQENEEAKPLIVANGKKLEATWKIMRDDQQYSADQAQKSKEWKSWKTKK